MQFHVLSSSRPRTSYPSPSGLTIATQNLGQCDTASGITDNTLLVSAVASWVAPPSDYYGCEAHRYDERSRRKIKGWWGKISFVGDLVNLHVAVGVGVVRKLCVFDLCKAMDIDFLGVTASGPTSRSGCGVRPHVLGDQSVDYRTCTSGMRCVWHRVPGGRVS